MKSMSLLSMRRPSSAPSSSNSTRGKKFSSTPARLGAKPNRNSDASTVNTAQSSKSNPLPVSAHQSSKTPRLSTGSSRSNNSHISNKTQCSNPNNSDHTSFLVTNPHNSIIPGNVFQLQLENSELRSKLASIEDSMDESKTELLNLLNEQTSQNEQLQNKVQQLTNGFVEIDKERKALKRGADLANEDRNRMEEKCKQLNRHLKMREREVEALAERCREQERRLELVGGEAMDQKRKMDQMEEELREMEKLRRMLEVAKDQERRLFEEEKMTRKKLHEVSLVAEQKDIELAGLKRREEALVREVEKTKTMFEQSERERKSESARWVEKEHKLNNNLQEKDNRVASLIQDLQSSKEENERMFQQMKEKLDRQTAESESQRTELRQQLSREKKEVEETFQTELDAKISAIQSLENQSRCLRAEMDQLQQDHTHRLSQMEKEIQHMKESNDSLEREYSGKVQANNQLQKELQNERKLNQTSQSDLKSSNEKLRTENGTLSNELHTAKNELTSTRNELNSARHQNATLQQEQLSLNEMHSRFKEEIATLQSRIEMMNVDHEDQLSQKSKRVTALENELSSEKITSNSLRSQLRELNLQVQDNASVRQEELRKLERELQNAHRTVALKEEEISGFQTRLKLAMENHKVEMESLKREHEAQMLDLETQSADVVSDLETTIDALRKEVSHASDNHGHALSKMQQTISQATLEKERMARLLAEREKRCEEQQEMIHLLTSSGKKRSEEVKTLQKELTRVRHILESSSKENEDTVDAIRSELEGARLKHEKEMSDLQIIVDDVRRQLASAKEKLASEDGEVNRVKATLTERTNLLRDMVNQTTAYQSDYEREHTRANQLDEAVRSCKTELAEAREMTKRLEQEMHEKEMEYCETIRNEHSQRKAAESKLELSKQSMEEALRRNNEMEKENSMLKDKVQRQENYISRLQDREKQERDRRRGPLGSSRLLNRPSSSGVNEVFRSRSPPRGTVGPKHQRFVSMSSVTYPTQQLSQHQKIPCSKSSDGNEENETPRVAAKRSAPSSPDELDELLGSPLMRAGTS